MYGSGNLLILLILANPFVVDSARHAGNARLGGGVAFNPITAVINYFYPAESEAKVEAPAKPEGNAETSCFNPPGKDCNVEARTRQLVTKWLRSDAVVLEVGARYGSVSCTISHVQGKSGKLVSVEPDSRVWKALSENLANHDCDAKILKGVVGTQPVKLEGSDYGTHVVTSGSGNAGGASALPFHEVQRKYGMNFDTVVIDCEGCFATLLAQNEDMFSGIHTAILEIHDDAEDAALNTLMQQGFKEVETLKDGSQLQHVLQRA